MGIAERKEREKLQRRNSIIDAAERVFFTKGYETATMDEVAEQAELSKGTLYLYFQSKEELFMAINLRGMNILHRMFRDTEDKHWQSGMEILVACGKSYLEFSQKYPNYFDVINHHEVIHNSDNVTSETKEGCVDIGNQIISILVQGVERGIQDGSVKSTFDPKLLSLLLWGSLHGTILLYKTKISQTPMKEAFSEVEFDTYIQQYFDLTTYGMSS